MYKSGNNNGNGYWFKFSDGYQGWVLGMSRTELKHEELKHGKLIAYEPAK